MWPSFGMDMGQLLEFIDILKLHRNNLQLLRFSAFNAEFYLSIYLRNNRIWIRNILGQFLKKAHNMSL